MAQFAHYGIPPGPTCGLPECSRRPYVKDHIVHDYCCRGHAREAVNRGLLHDLASPHGTCHRCQLHGCAEEVYYEEDTGRVHDFCSYRHAQMAMARGQWPRRDMRGYSQCTLPSCSNPVFRDPHTGQESEFCCHSHREQGLYTGPQECEYDECFRPAWVDPNTGVNLRYCGSACADAGFERHLVGGRRCSLPGCVEPTFLNPETGEDMGYCCVDHHDRAVARQLGPNTDPFVDRTFRGGTSSDSDFQLSVLTNRDPKYAELKGQFMCKWQKPENGLRVERILRIKVPGDVLSSCQEYASMVDNKRRRFHGTSCSDACRFFVDLRGGPCGEPSCNVCNICTHGFKMQGYAGRTAQNTNFNLRYGEGLYFFSVSGKANDYASGSEKDGPKGRKYRCMFMASVAVGNAYRTQMGSLPPDLCPPTGYDSVVAEVGPDLNYDEVTVYEEQAALPTYLIVYSSEFFDS